MENYYAFPDAKEFFSEKVLQEFNFIKKYIFMVQKQEKELKNIKRQVSKISEKMKMSDPILKHTIDPEGVTKWILYDNANKEKKVVFDGIALDGIGAALSPLNVYHMYICSQKFDDFLHNIENEGIILEHHKNPYISVVYDLMKSCQAVEKSHEGFHWLDGIESEKLISFCESKYPWIKELKKEYVVDRCLEWYNI